MPPTDARRQIGGTSRMTRQSVQTREQQAELAADDYQRDLGDGLLLRWTTPGDVERVCDLYAYVYRQGPDAPLNKHTPIWTRDMFSGRHPNIGPRDFAVVEDTTTGQIVAGTCLLRYNCLFEEIPF